MRVEGDWVRVRARTAEVNGARGRALLRRRELGGSFGFAQDDRVWVGLGGLGAEIFAPTDADDEVIVMNGAPGSL